MTERPDVLPHDAQNAALVDNLSPADWSNPDPGSERYNLLVVGAGPAGLITALGAAGVGARVALIENHLLGGDCLNVGCVPSKALIRSSRSLAELREARALGVATPEVEAAQFTAAMERLRRLRAEISAHDAATGLRDKGIDVFLGEGRFTGRDTFEIDGQTIRFKRAAICTGARAAVPDLPGLEEAGYLTNETLFALTERPDRLAVIGGGPIGCEMAQAFAQFGTRVTVIQLIDQFLPREDPEAAAILAEAFRHDGIDVRLGAKPIQVSVENGEKHIRIEANGGTETIVADAILVAAGRAPNIEGMDLDIAGVKTNTHGVVVNDYLRTTNPSIFAAGDVCMRYQFTHAADAAARILVQNALFKGRKRLSALNVPWCTYTHPEIAHVGLYARDAAESHIEIDTYTTPFADLDRAICDGETEGFVKVHTRKGSDEILGATIVASHAGEMIGEICVAMTGSVGLGAIGNTIHPYPTQAEAIKHTGDAYNRTRFTPTVAKWFKRWLAWTR